MAWKNGTITRSTNGGWKRKNAGRAVKACVKSQRVGRLFKGVSESLCFG